MLRPALDLYGSTIQATDGEIGEVKEFFFDNDDWTIRYLVVETGSWLQGKRVLISPMSITHVNDDLVEVDLTCQQVKDSPDVDTQKPFSRQMELMYTNYYRFPIYWHGAGVWGIGPYPSGNISPGYWRDPDIQENELRAAIEGRSADSIDTHLHSSREVKGYRIGSKDGRFGNIEDFLFDEQTWQIRYLVVDTINFWPSKSVLISPDWVFSISWNDREVQVNLTEEQIKSSPKYDRGQLVSREYEEQLYQHYGLEEYWISGSDRRSRMDQDRPRM